VEGLDPLTLQAGCPPHGSEYLLFLLAQLAGRLNSRPQQRFNIVKLDGVTNQRTLVSRLGRVWVGTEPAAHVEALRLGAAETDHERWSYEVIAEARR
jgi:hypothetical protein